MVQEQRGFTKYKDSIGKSPLLIYTVSYIFGILLGNKYTFSSSILMAFTFISALISLTVFMLWCRKRSILTDMLIPTITLTTFLLLGWSNFGLSRYSHLKRENSILHENVPVSLTCIIKDKPVEKVKSNQIQAQIEGLDESIVLYTEKEFSIEGLGVGDTLILTAYPKGIINSRFSKFDYAKYMEKQGYYFTSNVRGNEIIVHNIKKLTIKRWIYELKERYIKKLSEMIGNSQETATLIAITIGDKSYLNSQIKDHYSKSGIMHLLAVSGLHVAFIYSFISFFLSVFGNSDTAKFSRFVIKNIILWCYASLVGFAPSVLRAVVMATIYQISKLMQRERHALNTLCLSAIIITTIDPGALFDVGFQLSYIALISILLIQPKIEKYYLPENKISKYLWNTISITMACQAGTGLISVCTFGYFPIYFLLTNLIAIPLSAIVLYVALTMLIFIWNSTISVWISSLLIYLLRSMNTLVERIESAPLSTINISFDNGQILSLTMILVIYTFDLINDKLQRKYIYIALLVSFVLCSL